MNHARSPGVVLRLVLLAAAIAGCGDNALPTPTVTQVFPASMAESESVQAEVTVQAVLPFSVSLDHSNAAADPSVVVQLGPLSPVAARLDSQGRAQLFVPSVLAAGTYDVKVTLADGRSTTLANGFTVTPGSWPNSYTFDTIDDQHADVPFTVTLRAQGPAASTFHGTVALSAPFRGVVTPAESGPFTNGVRVEMISIHPTTSSQDTALVARDLGDHLGVSNNFKLRP